MTPQEIAGRWDRDGFLVLRDAIPSEVLEPVGAFIGAAGCWPAHLERWRLSVRGVRAGYLDSSRAARHHWGP